MVILSPPGDHCSWKEPDENRIKELLFNDAYHWIRWLKPVMLHGFLNLLAKPILVAVICNALVACWNPRVGLCLANAVFSSLSILYLVKLYLYLAHFWGGAEFVASSLVEYYSAERFAFFVAEDEGKIVGCVGVTRPREQVHF